MTDPSELYFAIREEVSRVLIGNDEIVEMLTIALLTRGHILLEGVPGVAKTTVANLFARATGLEYNRIQMTPDILPADITGTNIYRDRTGEFELQKGPVFSNLVVADEINRATPKTQSALLESMQEQRATIEGDTYELPAPFMVIATQNPIEMEGTFELPEAQRDRFQFKLTMGLPDRSEEEALVARFDDDHDLGPDVVDQVVAPDAFLDARDHVEAVHMDDAVRDYFLDIIERSRSHDDVAHGASPRATLEFLRATKARAALHDRDYVIPQDVEVLATPVLAHRLVLRSDAEFSGITTTGLVEELLEAVTPPSEAITENPPADDVP